MVDKINKKTIKMKNVIKDLHVFDNLRIMLHKLDIPLDWSLMMSYVYYLNAGE